MADMTAGDVMVPTRHMDLLDIDAPYDELLHVIIRTGHSRFPVYEERKDNIIGILLAKDLLKLHRSPHLHLRTLLRPAAFVPESKALNDLLRDFRSNRNHLAVVIDEFGSTAGLLTIEDVLEEIVGDIDDEHDPEEVEFIREETGPDGKPCYAVRALTRIDDFNDFFECDLTDDDYDTVGGLVMRELGRLPRRGERVKFNGFDFRVVKADRRRIDTLMVQREPQDPVAA
jgi:magnesium and cobalt transporter